MELKPHDLLRVYAMEDLVADLPFPAWAKEAVLNAPFVVVRRAETSKGMVAVGIRGPQRGQRLACWLPIGVVKEVITPFDLAERKNWKSVYTGDAPATVTSLEQISLLMKESAYQWGPTGSTGFELATGVSTVKERSDLDLIIDMPGTLSVRTATELLNSMEDISAVRLDIQLNTPYGGISLKEFTAASTVLVKTNHGPVLMDVSNITL
ncbi:MAG: malonate decarboxylase holo-ACP synthase [Pedobacter sp.]|uniref:malonate decarboxylase holo-ACP synthase n=1 Tax=Pedobacter sp. TaxID=1411316 RepID=UPI0033972F58